MIKHVIMWTLKDEFNGQNKAELARELKERLLDLKNKISQIKSLEVGINGFNAEKNHDVVLVSEFENFEDLKAYSVHPDHMELVKFVREISTNRSAVDYTM